MNFKFEVRGVLEIVQHGCAFWYSFGRMMKRPIQDALIVLAVAAGINLILYLAQHLLGWSIAFRYGAGALLLLFGAISIQGDGARDTLITRRYARTTSQEDDLEEFKDARRKGAAAGWQFILVGAATLALTLLFP